MARTHNKVGYSPSGKETKHTPVTAASGVEQAFKFLEGSWKLLIVFRLFGGKMLRLLKPPEMDRWRGVDEILDSDYRDNCKDYVVLKEELLKRAGIPRNGTLSWCAPATNSTSCCGCPLGIRT